MLEGFEARELRDGHTKKGGTRYTLYTRTASLSARLGSGWGRNENRATALGPLVPRKRKSGNVHTD